MKLKGALLALLISFSSYAFSSALVTRNSQTNTYTVKATLIFYGTAATNEVAFATSSEIHRLWNLPPKKNRPIVKFQIFYSIMSELEAKKMAGRNTKAQFNFIRLEPNNPENISFYFMGENSGMFVLKDKLGSSTTAAHEFGHGLGLSHPKEDDFVGKGNAGIMAPRGIWVDPEFQYDPKARPGDVGGFIDPSKRSVTRQNIDDLKLDELKYNENDEAELGKADSVILKANGKRAK